MYSSARCDGIYCIACCPTDGRRWCLIDGESMADGRRRTMMLKGDSDIRPFSEIGGEALVRGFLHAPANASGDGLVLTHGAGATCGRIAPTSTPRTFSNS